MIVFRFVGRFILRGRGPTLIGVNPAGQLPEIRFSRKSEVRPGVLRLQRNGVAEAEDLSIFRVEMGRVTVGLGCRDHAAQPVVVPILVADPMAFPRSGDITRWYWFLRRGTPLAAERGTTGQN